MQDYIHNHGDFKKLRRQLRHNLTQAEARLWQSLQNGQLDGRKFRRQHSAGNYILDFYCPKERLGIELDGRSHFTDNGFEADEIRTAFLNSLNIKILRFENSEVFNQLEGVLEEIRRNFTTPTPPKIGGESGQFLSRACRLKLWLIPIKQKKQLQMGCFFVLNI